MSELVVRPSLPEVPTAESVGAMLGRYLQVTSVEVDFTSRRTLRIDGLLCHDPDAGTPAAIRRSFLDSLDAVIAIMDAAGARWMYHPQVFIAGEVLHRLDGSQEFARIEGRVTLNFWLLA